MRTIIVWFTPGGGLITGIREWKLSGGVTMGMLQSTAEPGVTRRGESDEG